MSRKRYDLTWSGRLPGLPLVGEHLLLHVLDGPGSPGLVVQGALLEVSRAQPESYPGHEGALGGVEEEDGEEAGPHCAELPLTLPTENISSL